MVPVALASQAETACMPLSPVLAAHLKRDMTDFKLI